jgi:hypothetical protein
VIIWVLIRCICLKDPLIITCCSPVLQRVSSFPAKYHITILSNTIITPCSGKQVQMLATGRRAVRLR